jgi:hypothetical protein
MKKNKKVFPQHVMLTIPFNILIHIEEGDSYMAECTDIQDCYAYGRTIVEVIEEIKNEINNKTKVNMYNL